MNGSLLKWMLILFCCTKYYEISLMQKIFINTNNYTLYTKVYYITIILSITIY